MELRRAMRRIGWWARKLAIPLSMVALGLAIMAYGEQVGREAEESSLWPSTTGRIVVSRIAVTRFDRDESRPRGDELRYSPDIRYEYRVQGVPYSGAGIRRIVVLSRERAAVQPVLERYPVGERVPVYYNPRDPTDAVLEPGTDEDSYLAFYAGILWTVVWSVVLAVVAVVVYVKHAR